MIILCNICDSNETQFSEDERENWWDLSWRVSGKLKSLAIYNPSDWDGFNLESTSSEGQKSYFC